MQWISFENGTGKVTASQAPRAVIKVVCDKAKLAEIDEGKLEEYIAKINVDIAFADGNTTIGKLAVKAAPVMDAKAIAQKLAKANDIQVNADELAGCFMEHNGIISMESCHYVEASEVDGASYDRIKYLGRTRGAVKCFPATKDFCGKDDAPFVRYDFVSMEGGKYNIEIDMLARNPVVLGQDMLVAVAIDDGEKVLLNGVNKNFYAGHTSGQWCAGVLDNVRRIKAIVDVKPGKNSLYVYAQSPNVSFDKIVLWKESVKLPESYLGPTGSYIL